jgi:multidrug efflux pump
VMGGLVVATLLTLVFLPALYVAWFRIQPEEDTSASTGELLEGWDADLGALKQAAE